LLLRCFKEHQAVKLQSGTETWAVDESLAFCSPQFLLIDS